MTNCYSSLWGTATKKQKVPHKSVWIARKVPHKNVIDFVISLIFSVIRDKRMFPNIHLKQKYGLGYRVLCEPVDSFCGEYDKKNKSGSSQKTFGCRSLSCTLGIRKSWISPNFVNYISKNKDVYFEIRAFSCDKTLIKR